MELQGRVNESKGKIKEVERGGQEEWTSRWRKSWVLSEYLFGHMNWFWGPGEDVNENVNYDQKLWELSVDPGDKEFCQVSSQCAWTHL